MSEHRKKMCISCGQLLAASICNFYRHPQMADGLLNKCKECTKRDNIENREAKIDYYRAYDAKRAAQPKRVAARVAYRKTEAGKAAVMRAHRAQRVISPEKYKARLIVANAIRNGELARQPCQVCGEIKTEAHHDDYSQPLSIRWLCSKHHRQHHRREQERMRQRA